MRVIPGKQNVVGIDAVTLKVRPGFRKTLKAHVDIGHGVLIDLGWVAGHTEVYADVEDGMLILSPRPLDDVLGGSYLVRAKSYGGEVVLPAKSLGITKPRPTRVDLRYITHVDDCDLVVKL